MSDKIERLTPKQEQQLGAYLAQWLEIGRSTEPIDEKKTKAVLINFYSRLGKPAPKFLTFDSPGQCCIGAPLFLRLIGAIPKDADTKKLSEQILSARYAQRWWSSWVAFYRFCESIGVPYSKEDSELLALWDELSRACHWFFPFENWCILSRAPTLVEIDQGGRIHGGIEYADGTGVWAYHGIRVPRGAMREKNCVTIAKIEAETNAEIKRAYIEIYGTGKYLTESGAEEVHRDEYGILLRKQVGDETLLSVRVLNSTPEPDGMLSTAEARKIFGQIRETIPVYDANKNQINFREVQADDRWKEYFLDVHPELRPLLDPQIDGRELGEPQALTARNAVASTFGMRGEEYCPTVET